MAKQSGFSNSLKQVTLFLVENVLLTNQCVHCFDLKS